MAELRKMADAFYVRRGQRQQGPVTQNRILAALKAGSIRPSDEIASSPDGPWRTVGEALGRRTVEVPLVEAFTLKKSLLGRQYVASYACIHCRAPLESDESEWAGIETCPTCGKRYRISPQAAQQASAERRQLTVEKAASDAAAAKAQAAKQAAKEAAAMHRAEQARLAARQRQQQDAASLAAEAEAIQTATAVRRRPGACWYCGQSCSQHWVQCRFCMVIVKRTSNG